MSRIKVKNFGPIKDGFDSEDGFMDIKKVTVFIGDQGTGKSSVAKLIAVFMWLEKALNRGDIDAETINFDRILRLCSYQLVADYFKENTEVTYEGELYSITCNLKKSFPIVEKIYKAKYVVPQIMYVSSERNFLTTISSAFEVKGLPGHLFTFAEELKKAQLALNNARLILPIGSYKYEYNKANDRSLIFGEDYNVELHKATSGLQSLVPLFLVSRNLAISVLNESDNSINVTQSLKRNDEIARLMLNKSLSDEEKRVRLEEISTKYKNKCFVNIVEEPEQNLFPTSQRNLLNSLLEFANMSEGNKLIMTTHSPYIISYLSIAIQGEHLLEKIQASSQPERLLPMLNEVVPQNALIEKKDMVVYQLQKDGAITRLPDYNGIPSDANYLNSSLAESNQLFDRLLEIEEEL